MNSKDGFLLELFDQRIYRTLIAPDGIYLPSGAFLPSKPLINPTQSVLTRFILDSQVSALSDSGCGMTNQVANRFQFHTKRLHNRNIGHSAAVRCQNGHAIDGGEALLKLVPKERRVTGFAFSSALPDEDFVGVPECNRCRSNGLRNGYDSVAASVLGSADFSHTFDPFHRLFHKDEGSVLCDMPRF